MLDGTHRLMSLIAVGVTQVEAYYTRPNGRPSRPMIGDSTLVNLRHLYESAADDEQKNAVLTVVRQLLHTTSDAKSAMQGYWNEYAKNDDVRVAAKKLLES